MILQAALLVHRNNVVCIMIIMTFYVVFYPVWSRENRSGFIEPNKRDNALNIEVPTYFKPTNTLSQLLVHPKDPVGKDKGQRAQCIKISCEECEATSVGETQRSLRARFGEHSSTTLKVSKHIYTDNPNHTITLENTCTKILSVVWKRSEWGNIHPGLETFI